MTNSRKLKVLFVCMGNICRSPLAEGVFRHQVRAAGLADRFDIDSAGTASYHIGDPPDQRTTSVARARGIELTGRARQIKALDLRDFDYVLVMDAQNMARVQQLAGSTKPTAEVRMLRDFDEEAEDDLDVPDPYYGGPRGFEDVHDIVERACARLLEHIRAQHDL
ncbi:MAG TPA: low molecular weight protein-tyrosine-phosphatase [Longimicrobiales bacterium]